MTVTLRQSLLLLCFPWVALGFVVRSPAQAPAPAPAPAPALGRPCLCRWLQLSLNDSNNYDNDDDDDDEQQQEDIFFDDFGGFVVGGAGDQKSSNGAGSADDDVASSLSSLQTRMTQLTQLEESIQSRISQNWNQGHWSVRGCSLDPGDAEDGSKIQVSSLCPIIDTVGDYYNDESNEDTVLLVGRTDGSVCWLRLGSEEYLAMFTNQLVAKETSNQTIAVTSELKRQEEEENDGGGGEGAYAKQPQPRQIDDTRKFRLLGQLQASDAAICHMMVVDSEHLLVVDNDRPNQIQQFRISEEGPESDTNAIVLETGSNDPLVSLKSLVLPGKSAYGSDDNLVVSTSRKGQVTLWNVGIESSIRGQARIPIEDDDTILSFSLDSEYLYFGTAQGMVYVCSLATFLSFEKYPIEKTLEPLKSYSVCPNGGVSALCAAGPGVMGRGTTTTRSLVTATTLGEIKQWELIPRGDNGVEHWPKMASQTMPGKAHVFASSSSDAVAGEDVEPVLELKIIQKDLILSATQSRLTLWDTTTGKARFDMQGLEFEPSGVISPSCVVLSSHLLVTNGMEQYVCVHDFSIEELEDIEDMIERDDE